MNPPAPLMRHEKLARIRGVVPNPLGVRLAFGQHGCIWTGFAFVMFGLAALALVGLASTRSGVFVIAALVPALAGAASLYAGRVVFLAPRTPERAFRNFFEFISRGSFSSAWEMLVPTERQPGTGVFPNIESFCGYWREMRKAYGLRSGKLFFEHMSVETLAPDVAMCRCNVVAAPQVLFIPIPGGYASTNLGSGQNLYMQKLLVRKGQDWLVWSPEAFSNDEADVRWLAPGS